MKSSVLGHQMSPDGGPSFVFVKQHLTFSIRRANHLFIILNPAEALIYHFMRHRIQTRIHKKVLHFDVSVVKLKYAK